MVVNNVCFAQLGHNSQRFFDAVHPMSEKNDSITTAYIKGTAPLSSASLAAALASFGAARKALRKASAREDRPFNVKRTILLVPPAQESIAMALMSVEMLEDSSPNPYKNAAAVVVSPGLKSDTDWFLLDASKPISSVTHQKFSASMSASQIDENSSIASLPSKYRYGPPARGAAGDRPRLYRSRLV